MLCPLELSQSDMFDPRLGAMMLNVVEVSYGGVVWGNIMAARITSCWIGAATNQPRVSELIIAESADFMTELRQSDLLDPGAKVLNMVDVSYGGGMLDKITISWSDVCLCAFQWVEKEWRLRTIEQRECASLKTRIAATELAKLSSRVGDDQVGQSFISSITAKILVSIRVSIRSVQVVYNNRQKESTIGLRFLKQNSIGSTSGKVKGGQVNKCVEIDGLEFDCSSDEGIWHSSNSRSNSVQSGENDADKGNDAEMMPTKAKDAEMKNDAEMKKDAEGMKCSQGESTEVVNQSTEMGTAAKGVD